MLRNFISILILTIGFSAFGQTDADSSFITGFAPEFIGQQVKVYTYQDYVTQSKIVIGEGVVSAADSSFRVQIKTNSTVKAIVEIDRNESSLYLAPGKDYTIYFPRSTEPVSYKNAETNLYFSDLDTSDINYRVLQYHQWFDSFIYYYRDSISKSSFLSYLDTFKLYAAEAYKDYNDPFFITYVRYDIAELEQSYGGNRRSEKRLETFLTYIEPFPVYYENDRYMKFILAFYDKEFREYLPVTEKAIMHAIHESSPTLLMQTLKSDIFLANPDLRELVMVDKLGKAFYREIDYRPNIITILDSVANNGRSEVNAAVARNVKKYITNLEPGYPAPVIQLEVEPDSTLGWSHYRGKFVYFNFFATWNERSMNDMEVISKLVPKYDEDIAFLSVCTDRNRAALDAFLAEHPEYDWDIIYIGEDIELMRSYKVTSVPSYYLIDQDGFIFSAPALAPTPNGENEYVEMTLAKIKEALHPRQAPRVGQ